MSIFRDNTRNGFFKASEVKTVADFWVKKEVRNGLPKIHEEIIREQLILKLSHELFKSKIVTLHSMKTFERDRTVYIASINVAPPGTSYMNIEGETFVANGEKFSEEEFIQAVKIAYPERLL